jgi:hypothetical protein
MISSQEEGTRGGARIKPANRTDKNLLRGPFYAFSATSGTNFCGGAEYHPFAFCTAVMLPLVRNAPNIKPAKSLVMRGT